MNNHIRKISFINRILLFAFTINIYFQIATAVVWKEPASVEEHAQEITSAPEECWQLYPFTYSKCIKLCSPALDATCLDDQLCFCNSTISYFREGELSNMQLKELHYEETSTLQSLNTKFGAHDRATCLFSDFCQELCKEDQSLGTDFPGRVLYGALCKITAENGYFHEDTESCLCTFE